MASLGQLTAGIAHEINNPINFVSANVKPLQMDISDILDVLNRYESITPDDNLTEKLASIEAFKKEIDLDYVKTEINTLLGGIEDGAKRTAEIVKGLKNFSHLDESDVKEADINQGIESTLVLLRSTTPPNIEIVKNLGEIPMIECYPGKLNQVFMNIINNAIQAMEKCYTREKHNLTLTTFLKDEHVQVVRKLKENRLQFHIGEEKLTGRTEKLAGLSIIISGTFEKYSRDELKDMIEQNGGKNVGSISKKTNYLLAGENMGPSKLEKANQLGVPIISEDDFLKMLE